MGRSWPLQSAQPLGGKLNGTRAISPSHGSTESVDSTPATAAFGRDNRRAPTAAAMRPRAPRRSSLGAGDEGGIGVSAAMAASGVVVADGPSIITFRG